MNGRKSLALGLAVAVILTSGAYAADPAMPLGGDIYWGDTPASTYDAANSARARAACRAVRNLRPSAADFADARAHPQAKDCRPAALLYGMNGTPRDPVGARRCALPRLAENTGMDLDPDAPSVLMVIYAKGEGTARNLDLATRFACGLPIAADAEREIRANHLQDLKSGASTARFDFCTDITSGWAGGQCANIEAGQAASRRAVRLQILTRGWDPAQRTALVRLQRAEKAFAEQHGGECDMDGTLRYSFMIAGQERVLNFSAALFDQLVVGKTPSNMSAALADQRLNATYQRTLAALKRGGGLDNSSRSPTVDDVRSAQRAWLAYRDRWLALARLKWPERVEAIRAALSLERTRQLGQIV